MSLLCAGLQGSAGHQLDLTHWVARDFILCIRGDLLSIQIPELWFPFPLMPCCCSPTEQSRASLFVLRGSLRGKVVVVESPFLVKAAAQEGAMEMGVIHSFCFKYVTGKGLKTDFHIPYATELFYLYASLRKTGKTKNIKHLQMVEKNPESLFWCWFSIKPKVFLGTKGLDPPRFIFLNPIWLSWQFNES